MSVKNKARDRLPGGRLKSYRRVGSHFASCARWFDKSPSWYRNMMMTRPERHDKPSDNSALFLIQPEYQLSLLPVTRLK
ncbi:hypothetical protein ABVX89_004710 [Escherichia coli]